MTLYRGDVLPGLLTSFHRFWLRMFMICYSLYRLVVSAHDHARVTARRRVMLAACLVYGPIMSSQDVSEQCDRRRLRFGLVMSTLVHVKKADL